MMNSLKELQEKLNQYEERENELKFRLEELTDFVENSVVPLHRVDANGIIIWANQTELDFLGYSKEEYIGQPISNFHTDEFLINDILARLAKNETIQNYRTKLRCKDGTIKYVLLNSNVFQKDGKFIHTRCFTTDITQSIKEEEKRADLLIALEHSEAHLKMAIESTNLGTWNYNPLSGALNWSEECKKIYGLPQESTISFEQFMDHIFPEDKEHVQRAVQNAMAPDGSRHYNITYRIIRFDDHSIRWIKAQGKTYLNAQQQTERFAGTVVDITEHKLAEEKSAKLAAIVESSNDAIISKNLNSIITSWNISAERTFGYTETEMLGQSILKLIPEDRLGEEPQILSRLKKGDRVEHFETKRLTKAGNLLDVSLTISPIKDPHGNIIGLSKIARDITDKKREELRKNDFIAMVSHELKTPLTSIKSYVQIMLAKAKKDADIFGINTLSRAEIQTKKMTDMIHDFLNLSRLEEGKIMLNKTIFELHPLIEEILSDAQLVSPHHHIQFKGCDAVILLADRDKIGQVLINLLSNAIKYSPNGGTITIECEVSIRNVKISISDHGVGINPIDQTNLFHRFYRVKNEKIKNISGFGIGLYLVSEILRYHDSLISVKSIEGEGSTFYFNLETQII